MSKTEAIVQGIHGAGLQIFFTPLEKIINYRDFQSCDRKKYKLFQKELLRLMKIVFHVQLEKLKKRQGLEFPSRFLII